MPTSSKLIDASVSVSKTHTSQSARCVGHPAESLGPNLERSASASCVVRPTNVAEGLETSWADAEGLELIELQLRAYFCWMLIRNSVTFCSRTYPRS